MTYLSKIFLIYVLGLLLTGEVKPKDYHPEETTNINGKDARASLTSTSLFLTPEQDECVANYPGLKAEYIKEGVTIIGFLGTSSFTFPNCSEDISENCITSS